MRSRDSKNLYRLCWRAGWLAGWLAHVICKVIRVNALIEGKLSSYAAEA